MGKAYKGKDDVGAGWLFETSIVGLNVTAGIVGLNAAHIFPSVALTFSIDFNKIFSILLNIHLQNAYI